MIRNNEQALFARLSYPEAPLIYIGQDQLNRYRRERDEEREHNRERSQFGVTLGC